MLVVDVLGGSNEVLPVLADMVANSVAIVKAARAAGVPVIFADDAHVPGLDRELELWCEHGIAGTVDAKPADSFVLGDVD